MEREEEERGSIQHLELDGGRVETIGCSCKESNKISDDSPISAGAVVLDTDL
jgi:hypothetical protein